MQPIRPTGAVARLGRCGGFLLARHTEQRAVVARRIRADSAASGVARRGSAAAGAASGLSSFFLLGCQGRVGVVDRLLEEGELVRRDQAASRPLAGDVERRWAASAVTSK